MQTKEKTKMLGSPQEYFFPGGLEYKPLTVTANSQEEADEIYEKEKQKVELLPTNETENNL
jgi:hypothetical protein